MVMWEGRHLKTLVDQLSARRHSWLAQHQKKALNQFLKSGFPEQTQPAWRHTSTKAIEEATFKLPSFPNNLKDNASLKDLVSNTRFYTIVFLNGYYLEQFSASRTLESKKVTISSMTKLSNDAEIFMKKAVNDVDLLKIKDMPFYHLAQALLTDCIYINVSSGARLDKPIRLLHVTTDDFSYHMQHTFSFIQLEKNSKAVIYEEVKNDNAESSLINRVTQIALGQRSSLHYYNAQPCLKKVASTHQLILQQAQASDFRHYDITQGSMLSRNDRRIYLQGVNATASLKGIYSVKQDHHADHYIHISHCQSKTQSDQLYKGIAIDRAHAIFNSHVLIPQKVQCATASQLTQNLLLSNDAEIDLSPTLEIYADDVQCSHGATIGALDEKALFYLCSRGIDKDIAEGLLQQGFLTQVLEMMPDSVCRTSVRHLL